MREDIRPFFPYPSENAGQGYIIDAAIDAFEGGFENVIIEAPTGLGKTGVAITIARYMTREPGKKAHLLTSQKALQRAYLKDDPRIKLMMGKNNYDCERTNGFSCADSSQAFGYLCSGFCTYREARDAAQEAKITLHNYDSFLNQATLGGLFLPRELLCIDEAHDTEEHLIKTMTVEFKESEFGRLGLKWTTPRSGDIDGWVFLHGEEITKRRKDLDDEIKALVGVIRPGILMRLRKLTKSFQKLEKLERLANRYQDSKDKGVDWVAEVDSSSVTLEPVEAGRFAKAALLKFGEKRLLMSATIFNKGQPLIRALRLKRDDTKYIEVGSSFPPERRLVHPVAVAPLGHHDYEKNKMVAMDAIKEIVDRHSGQRGVIHCTSYKLSDDVRDNVDSDRFVFHSSENRNSVIERFLRGEYPPTAVLVAVSVTQGYDFKYDLCRFQIIPKVPFIYPSKRVLARREIDPGYYDWRTALALVQTTGRGNRAEDDFCSTYILDSRFSAFISRKRKMLPNWFLEAIVSSEEEDDYELLTE